jgi:hypothetical protein
MSAALVELQPYDPVGAAAVTIRATTDDDSRVCALNAVAWWPVLLRAGSYGLEGFDATFPGFAATPPARMELSLEAFPDAARYAWGDRPVKLWTGEPGTAWPWAQFFEGLVRDATVKDGRISLQVGVDDAWLDRPVLATYAGTGGLEGPASLKGVPKPLALGAPQFVAPVLIDAVKDIYQFHAYGAATAVTAALDRLVRYGAAAGNDPDYATLAAATIAPGAWRTCLAQGLVRFGAPPAGPLTLLVQGDAGGPDGWVRRAGVMIKRVALLAGVTTAKLDTTNLAALDTAAPYDLSVYQAAQVTARELIARISAAVNGLARVSLLGKLEVILPEIGSPALTLAADGSAEPQITPLELLQTGAPWWRAQMAGDRCNRVHGAGEYYEPPQGDPGPPGADGADGADGATGQSNAKAWQRSASQPATPADSASTPAGWYDDPADVPAGAGVIWAITGTKAVGAANFVWAAALRDEAVTIVTGDQQKPLGLGTSASLEFKLDAGASRDIEAAWRATLAATNTLGIDLEWRYEGGSWSAFGSDVPDSGGALDVVYATASGSVFNSDSVARRIEVRATGTRTNGGGGVTTDTSASFVAG